MRIRVFHRTPEPSATLRDGFRDDGYVLPGLGVSAGVRVSAEWPPDEREGADGAAVLALEIPDDLFEQYEWLEDETGYREALIPCAELNGIPVVRLSDDEVEELAIERLTRWYTRA